MIPLGSLFLAPLPDFSDSVDLGKTVLVGLYLKLWVFIKLSKLSDKHQLWEFSGQEY